MCFHGELTWKVAGSQISICLILSYFEVEMMEWIFPYWFFIWYLSNSVPGNECWKHPKSRIRLYKMRWGSWFGYNSIWKGEGIWKNTWIKERKWAIEIKRKRYKTMTNSNPWSTRGCACWVETVSKGERARRNGATRLDHTLFSGRCGFHTECKEQRWKADSRGMTRSAPWIWRSLCGCCVFRRWMLQPNTIQWKSRLIRILRCAHLPYSPDLATYVFRISSKVKMTIKLKQPQQCS